MSVDVVWQTGHQGGAVSGSAAGGAEDVELVQVPVVEVAAGEAGAAQALRPAGAGAPAGPGCMKVVIAVYGDGYTVI